MQHSSYQYPPRSHWVLKSPEHMFTLEQMLQTYPDACVIFTHRHPASVICSSLLIFLYAFNIYFPADHDVTKQLAQDCFQKAYEFSRLFVGFRKKHSNPKQFLDLSFDEITQRPLDTMEKIYDHFGKHFTLKHRKLVEEYLQQESREGLSKIPKVKLEDTGFKMEEINEKFAEYLKAYLPASNEKRTKNID